jgi:hypothetical protein
MPSISWPFTSCRKNLWYVIPAHAFRGQASVALRPAGGDSKYAKYLGAWELMKPALQTPTEPEEDGERVFDAPDLPQ